MKGADRTLFDRMCLSRSQVCRDLGPGRIGLQRLEKVVRIEFGRIRNEARRSFWIGDVVRVDEDVGAFDGTHQRSPISIDDVAAPAVERHTTRTVA